MNYNSSNSLTSPFDGYIKLKNDGLFVARIRLVYTLKTSKYRTSKIQKVSKGQTKKIIMPEGAHTIFYYIEYANTLGKWNELKSDVLYEPTIICFKTSGNLANPKCEEIECNENTAGSTPTIKKPCCICRCHCCHYKKCCKNK